MTMMIQSSFILRTFLLQLQLLQLVCNTDAKMQIISSKQDIQVGEEILLLCKAGGDGDITWEKDGNEIDEDLVSRVDEGSSRVRIMMATLEDAGKYVCKCEFDNGHNDETKQQIFVYEGPSFGSTATYHEFLVGSKGLVPCLVYGKPAVEVDWLRNREVIPSNEGSHVRKLPDNTLLIEEVKREDAGTYVCQAKISGRQINQQLPVSVVVNAPPTVHLKEKVQNAIAGPETNISLLCLVDGHPKPNITWNMPVPFDPLHHQFNSDRSQLTIWSVVRSDFGEYVCTATNKIAESSQTLVLHVFEAPEVSVSAEQKSVSVGGNVSVSCNVSGHPQPELHWLSKYSRQSLDGSGRVRVVDGVLSIDEMLPSDGGLYSCMAVSSLGNASRDVAIFTQPGPPHYLSVSPGLNSVIFSLKSLPISGGTPITGFVLQWRQSVAEEWKELTLQTSDALVIASLKPYTSYEVRLAALNAEGVGQFSVIKTVRTKGQRGEPDSPVLSSDKIKMENNSFSIPFKQTDDGGTPILHYNIQYRQSKEGAEWKKKQLSPSTDTVVLSELSYGSEYQLEVTAVNINGSSLPATFNFTIADQPVDITCCYRNRCGLLMSIAVKLFGQRVPGLQALEEGDAPTNGDLKLKSTPRGSIQQAADQTYSKEAGQLAEVTYDKAPLTKHEKTQP
ncbi:neural cell adhesion molecule 1 isoform 2-T2 [Aulostomus maculatus]